MPKALTSLLVFLAFVCVYHTQASPEVDFRRPSLEIAKLAEKPWAPLYNTDPTRRRLMKLEATSLVPSTILARKEVNLAGIHMHSENRARSRRLFANRISLVEINSGEVHKVQGLPESPIILNVQWSPNGEFIGMLIELETKVEVWLVTASNYKAKKLSDLSVHAGMNHMMAWTSYSQSFWVKTVPDDLGPVPTMKMGRSSAVVRETTGEPIPAQTHQGLLRTQFDVDQFEYLFSSRLANISLDGSHKMVGESGIYRYFRESPDQRYLLVERLVKPWSYFVNADQFAYDIEVLDLETLQIKRITSAPLAEQLPYSGGIVRLGAREFQWRSDKPSTLVWVEALDGGDPYEFSKFRDQLLSLEAPFDDSPDVLVNLRERLGDILWHQSDKAVLITWNWVDRELITYSFNPEDPQERPRKLLSFEMGNRYRHPGLPLIRYNHAGFPVIHSDASGEHMYLVGEGSSLEGNRPFIDKFNLKSKRKKRLFRSNKPYFETPITLLDTESEELLVQRESKTMPSSYFLWNAKKKFHRQITFDENPYPEMAEVQRVLLRYKRADGINLTANLYLPPGYNAKDDGPLPTLIWAYPKAFQSADNASQLKKSPYQFLNGRWNRPIIWATQGYAVMDDPAMPIVAQARGNPNDSFIPQLVDSAKAAVRELVRRGVSEEGHIVIGGHSYGAFMTANLLAHTDLFCAGIARSGAYNRTLTPFGFQSEERNLWQTPRVYLEMSPFLNAKHINEPLLLLHGEKDENPGTYLLQSERLFHALNGLGGQARLVMFPDEGHTFRGEESIMHMLWEIERWLEIHLKGESPNSDPFVSQSEHQGNSANSSHSAGEKEERE